MAPQKIPPYFIVKTIEKISSFLMKVSRKMTPPGIDILNLVEGFWVAKSIGVASKLGIADILEEKPCNIDFLATKTSTHPDFLYRLLRMLSSIGVFKETKGKVFSNTPLSCTLLDKDDSMKYMVEHLTNPNNWEIVGAMEKSVRDGIAVSPLVLGKSVFEHLSKSPEDNARYNKSMVNASMMISMCLKKAYSFSAIKKLVDIGGGHGAIIKNLLNENEKLTGVLFDLPHVIEELIAKDNSNFSGRLIFESGDIFHSAPKADGYILKSFLHAFNDADCLKILNNIYDAADSGARILVLEPLIGKANEPSFGKLFDIQLMVGTDGGRERTKEEYLSLLKKSKLSINRFIRTISPFTIIEAVKK